MFLAGSDIPHAQRVVAAAAYELLSIRKEGDVPYGSEVAFELGCLLAAGEIPKADGVVRACRCQCPAVRREGQAEDGCFAASHCTMPFQPPQETAPARRPQMNGAVDITRRKNISFRRKRQRSGPDVVKHAQRLAGGGLVEVQTFVRTG